MPDAPAATPVLSTTRTSSPALARCQAVDRPCTPAPTTRCLTEAGRVGAMGRFLRVAIAYRATALPWALGSVPRARAPPPRRGEPARAARRADTRGRRALRPPAPGRGPGRRAPPLAADRRGGGDARGAAREGGGRRGRERRPRR